MGIVEALGKIESLNFNGTAWYQFLDMMSATAFAFLPVIVAISAAKVFGANIYLGAVLGLMMVHPSLLNGWNVGSEDAIMSMFGTTSIPTWNLFGNIQIGGYVLGSISRHGYQGHVIPIVIAVWVLAKIEKWLHKKVPEMLDLFVVPITSIFLTSLVTFMAIGPVFSLLENYVLEGAKFLITNPFGAVVIGALYPVTVVMGLHHMYNGIESGMLAQAGGFNTWMPVATAANFAQAGSSLAVGIKSKNAKTKSVAIPAALSASLGITEPAIFGINLRFMKPFLYALVGGACAGGVASFLHLAGTGMGITVLPGTLLYLDHLLEYVLVNLIGFGIAFGLTFTLFKPEE
jgi:PTS system sucrose-specific IIC component